MEWETVIGLEIHTQLTTRSKIFSGASTRFGAEPNTQACLVDLGFPGVLPVLNEAVVRKAILFGTAVEAQIARRSVFARKNYFYPDLPKGYQISQYELPIVGPGHVDIILEKGGSKRIGVTRAHLEEDAGKSLHEDFHGYTGIDLNRAGTPLLEIVSEPDMRSAKEAVAYAKKIHQIVTYLGICDGNMQEGSFRMDANVSVRLKGEEKFGTRTELKNLNSFRFLEKAINFEVERLLPLVIEESFIEETVKQMPELPEARRRRFESDYGLSAYDADVLTATRQQADYYEAVVAVAGDAKLSANWMMVELFGALNKAGLSLEESPISAQALGGLVKRIADSTISGKIAKTVFEAMWESGGSADEIIEAKGLKQITDSGAIEAIVDEVLAENAAQVENYRNADPKKQPKMLGFFVGQVMKKSQGKANPKQVNELLRAKLSG